MTHTTSTAVATAPRMRYGGLIAMMLMSFLLVTSEFLPNGVLTELAQSLGISDGQAGQMVSVTAFAGFLAAPTIGILVPRVDRRTLLAVMALLAALSNIVVAIAPSFALILAARFLLGVAIATFWAMSITVSARIAGPERLGRAVMFTTAGTSLATVAGVPLAVFLATFLEWRLVFAGAGVLMLLLAVAVRTLLPSVPPAQTSSFVILLDTLRRPGIGLGFAGHVLVVLGHFVAYTYIRLGLERVTLTPGGPTVDAGTIVLLLALFGAGGLVGNVALGLIADRAYAAASVLVPVLIAASVATVALAPGALWAVGVAIILWGFCFASWLIVVNTWVGHRAPDRLEAGGGLVVLGFQGAIMLAAGFGGLLIDALSVPIVYGIGAAALVLGAVLFGAAGRVRN